jgi:hypothetical protein
MIQTSNDLFWLIFALSLGLVSVVFCFAIFYVVLILRNTNKMLASVREKLEIIDKILKMVKDKMEKGSSHMSMIADSAIKLTSFLMDKKKKSSGKKK